MPHEQIEDSCHDKGDSAWKERCEDFDSSLQPESAIGCQTRVMCDCSGELTALRAQVSTLQTYAGDEIYRSDFRTAADMRAALDEEKRLHKHWKDQHANEVKRAKILKDTTDLPLERVRAYELMGELQGQVERLTNKVQGLEIEVSTMDAGLATSYEKGAADIRERAAVALQLEGEHSAPCWCQEAVDGMGGETCDCCHFIANVEERIRSLPLKGTV